ncbi:transcriptional regulator, AraC family [Leadbetterella byssophila DSM 17132]|uniref:Transcriptional regulator, AraC family n=1 Tax=Leadbetterella byssophila (strain DSM 17132 / JCM 16389 / KACC 11308 / NBRC 106382 / 4M15) TaxID=649349 RepID=E4RTH5_LEAB4|nr:AraC family transcriptional regulator [Leadbetterella byssophila]ADQ15989.1 transcriptional regulator, AraC family [Leadbetterella byssophila DSM 17132]
MAVQTKNDFNEIVCSVTEEKYYKDDLFFDYHSFVRVLSGEMKVIQADKTYVFGSGSTFLYPRNQLCTVIKYPLDGRPYRSIVMTLKPQRLEDFYKKQNVKSGESSSPKIKEFYPNPLLDSLFDSLLPYFRLNNQLPENLTTLKIEEAISVLRAIDKDVDGILADFSQPGKINLFDFMQKNYMFNLSLEKFSYLTGRSLSAFNRDFRSTFHSSPQKWLTQKRLELAQQRIREEKIKPVDVYVEVGFENLSHFSYAFKKQFGYAPSEIPSL